MAQWHWLVLKLSGQPKTGSGDDHACVALCRNAPPWRRQLRQVGSVAFSQGVAQSHLLPRDFAHNVDVGRLDA